MNLRLFVQSRAWLLRWPRPWSPCALNSIIALSTFWLSNIYSWTSGVGGDIASLQQLVGSIWVHGRERILTWVFYSLQILSQVLDLVEQSDQDFLSHGTIEVGENITFLNLHTIQVDWVTDMRLLGDFGQSRFKDKADNCFIPLHQITQQSSPLWAAPNPTPWQGGQISPKNL